MKSKSNNAFSLLEVILTVAILTTAIVFLFRSFTTVLSSVRFSQDITASCYLAEAKLWEAGQIIHNNPILNESGRQTIQGRDFLWNYKTEKLENSNLLELDFSVSWNENLRQEKTYTLNTYLLP